ncbi:hypothetical protein SAMD00019534_001480 [Acytostelium subglobosum LB1]|uniref:hypothetical protein n=1 Tax=Acytostelium subglobosum LB1 TaxID=1410327 RepID=UPI00064487F4|nr:hypothetical protein SAMD00019534_001480 [Acytostelium subglobosum LB1]GAM16973.1 hypothetical protein SAMD00019534_001480 [Acytostelium subglobosum LB1]|eukprot:XP_012759035.1 hypothetical protein SAMD00019534_001480 [Acytostelium subglobosum LB1]
MKSFQIIAALMLVTVTLAYARNAYFVFSDNTDEFTIKLTNPALIQHARDLIANRTQDGRGIMGKIIPRDTWYNWEWSFYLDPSTISFFDMATEVCDASISYVEEHLNEVGGALLPGRTWCPWASHLVREI